MPDLKRYLLDRRYLKVSAYTVLTGSALYLLFLIITHFDDIFKWILSGLESLASAFSPVLIGLVLSYLLSPLVRLIDKRILAPILPLNAGGTEQIVKRTGRRLALSILITYLLIAAAFCATIYALAVLIGGHLVFGGVEGIVDSVTAYFMQYEHLLRSLGYRMSGDGLQDHMRSFVDVIVRWLADHFSLRSVMRVVSGMGVSVLNFLLGVIVSMYLLKDRDLFLGYWRKLVHTVLCTEKSAKFNEAMSGIHEVLSRFLRGQLVDGLIVAILSSVGLSIVGIDFAVLIGCFAGIANIIPYFGPILGMIPAGIIGLLTGGPPKAVFAVLVLLLIQQIDSAVISPRVVGRSTGMHPVTVLIAVTVGGYYMGIAGMVLAVPVVGILRFFVLRLIEEKQRG